MMLYYLFYDFLSVGALLLYILPTCYGHSLQDKAHCLHLISVTCFTLMVLSYKRSPSVNRSPAESAQSRTNVTFVICICLIKGKIELKRIHFRLVHVLLPPICHDQVGKKRKKTQAFSILFFFWTQADCSRCKWMHVCLHLPAHRLTVNIWSC